MKNRWKHIFIPVLAMALCLSLAACGNSDDVAGEDWRTTGVVVGSGTITHDSESVDVRVTADPNSAAFYRDQEEQVLFDSVAFPETIEDISSSAFQISFDDQNGDEESELLVVAPTKVNGLSSNWILRAEGPLSIIISIR